MSVYRNQCDNSKQSNAEFDQERKQSLINPELLRSNLFDHQSLDIKKRIQQEIDNDPVLSQPMEAYFLSRNDSFKRVLDVCNRIINIKKKLGLTETVGLDFHRQLGHEIPLMLHDVVFAGCLKSLASDEQLKQWLPKVLNYQWFGSYSQTELGHGSNVGGIETTVHYIKETDEFEINSPTLSSVKWWVGALGRLSTHTIVFAQLWLHDENGKLKNYGPHPFLVQVRSLKDHTPVNGIKIGDIGPKFGFNLIDNGFIQFNKLRVPRSSMLQRFFSVTKDGKYISPPHPKLIYAGMVGVRTHLIEDAFTSLSKATTVAIRYSIIRKQFKRIGGGGDGKEIKVLEYGNQQNRIFPALAASFAFHCMGKQFYNAFQQMMNDIKTKGDLSKLAELHSLSSGLKSLVTYIAHSGIEQCRLACGGHGYSLLSGLPALQAGYAHLMTAEGENNILPQQTCKYLLKVYKDIVMGNGKLSSNPQSTTHYLLQESNSNINNIDEFIKQQSLSSGLSTLVLLKLYQHRSFVELSRLARLLQEGLEGGEIHQVWTDLNVDMIRVSNAYCQVYILDSFIRFVKTLPQSLQPVLNRLVDIYALYHLDATMGEFLQDGFMPLHYVDQVKSQLTKLYKSIRPDALSLTDAFALSDSSLASCLGRADGKVYESLFHMASNQPFNKDHIVVDGYDQFLRPLIQSKL